MEQPTCNCPDPTLCQRLKRHIHGRLWEIWNGVNIDPTSAKKYRDLWEREALEIAKLPAKGGVAVPELPKSGGEQKGCGCGGPKIRKIH